MTYTYLMSLVAKSLPPPLTANAWLMLNTGNIFIIGGERFIMTYVDKLAKHTFKPFNNEYFNGGDNDDGDDD